ncbi:Rieske (2Fe-2S) protein [Actinomadura rayongensis]|uniref:Cytochrome bc1 complex Rieske iron-sulfur subunit n=1 Tax=Actinomadura rayongensis TaxID=1429076 RepID=A0A6I4WIP4_9ACTN|nr:Rieske (2Fe-2S) protein [Actinomadura rayongensis]MXQ67596.1 Rieske 2Fe-2S domain-containing protein [Actinomadura rayongensis]
MNDDVTAGTPATRRTVLCGAGAFGAAAVLAACGPSDDKPAKSATELRGTEIAKTAEVPVGGGVINQQAKLVVTQPTAGTYKAFDATCTHQGCLTDKVSGGAIHCPCHGSAFKIADGSVQHGPAGRPLKEYPVQVKGDVIVVA